MEAKDILIQKNLGTWTPNYRLSNLAMTYFESAQYAHRRVFSVVPVNLPAGFYYEFSKADLARDNVGIKPPFGSVAPAVFGMTEKPYSCRVHQIIITQDKIINRPFEVANEALDPRKLRVETIIEQIHLHQEIDFAKKFFNANAWTNTWTGAESANVAQKQFKKFNEARVDPAKFIDERATDIRRAGRRKPNKLVLGLDVFAALKNNPFILDRVKYSGSVGNPAVVNENILAQIFGVERVIVLDATYNAGAIGVEDMQFVCDSKSALLLYAPDNPSTNDASAGEIFTWNIFGDNLVAIEEHEGAPASHTDLTEGLIAYDMRKTCDDLAIYLSGAVD